jgi:hypothetical protein
MDVNPYQSPSSDQPADAAGRREPVARDSDYLSPLVYLCRFISFLVFYSLQDAAVEDSIPLRHSGFPWKGWVVALAPLVCLAVWIIAFRVKSWRTLQCTPVIARHLILWVALTGIVFGFHWAFSPWTAH